MNEQLVGQYFTFLLGSFTALFSVVNPLAVIPVFVALTASDSPEWRAVQARKAAIYMTAILAFFLLAGSFIMGFFGISLDSIRVAGGIVIVRSGFMLLTTARKPDISKRTKQEGLVKEDISLTPLALPLLSGPGAIAVTISMATHTHDIMGYVLVLLAIAATGAISFALLRVSPKVAPLFGQAGLEAATRIMGFITMIVGVQYIMTGLRAFIEQILSNQNL